jgi:2,3-bisphosphoglycerate-independent phosphoglycerate mutase
MNKIHNPRPVVLCILDGWGYREATEDNAVAQAHTPNFDALWQNCPHSLLQASEGFVGLPSGQMGNSEIGHLHIGAGRVVRKELTEIDAAIADGSLAQNPRLQDFIAKLKVSGGICHLMGLLSGGGVHSHERHLLELARIVSAAEITVRIHAWLDGRDVAPQSAATIVPSFLAQLQTMPRVTLATLCGRYYAMDRDHRWERVERAYNLMTAAEGEIVTDLPASLQAQYDQKITDEFIPPLVTADYQGMQNGDGVLCANFRPDRVREILAALLDHDFKNFARKKQIKFAAAAGMAEYSAELNPLLLTLFPPVQLTETLGEIVANAGLKQVRAAETEKYPHVTFFFNGGQETAFVGEERILVPSPKVATYDLQPEMSAAELTQKVAVSIKSGVFDLVIVNYANPDMVGHSGKLDAAIKAVEAVDQGLGTLAEAVRAMQGAMLVIADHGNCEVMRDPVTGEPHTAHTTNPVPAILLGGPDDAALVDGGLADVAPTLLALLGLPQPRAMTGQNLCRSLAASVKHRVIGQ